VADTGYLSFEEAMQALHIDEEQLRNMVLANELRAFRIDRKMMFKAEDIAAMGGEAVPTVDLSEGIVSIEDDGEVVLLEDDGAGEMLEIEDVDFDDASTISLDEAEGTVILEEATQRRDAVGADATEFALDVDDDKTVAAINAPAADGLGTEEIIFEDEDLLLESGDDDALGTQEITVQEEAIDDLGLDDDDLDITVQEESISREGGTVKERAVSGKRARASSAPASARMSARGGSMRRRSLEKTVVKGNPIMSALIVLTVVVMLYPASVMINAAAAGYTTQRSLFTSGSLKHDGHVPMMGSLVVPKTLAFWRAKCAGSPISTDNKRNSNNEEWWGQPVYNPNPDVTEEAAPVKPVEEKKEGEAAAEGEKAEEKKEGEAPAEGEKAEEKKEGEAAAEGEKAEEKKEGEAPAEGEKAEEKKEGEAPAEGEKAEEKKEGEAAAEGEKAVEKKEGGEKAAE